MDTKLTLIGQILRFFAALIWLHTTTKLYWCNTYVISRTILTQTTDGLTKFEQGKLNCILSCPIMPIHCTVQNSRVIVTKFCCFISFSNHY